jgi:hypothetical protein
LLVLIFWCWSAGVELLASIHWCRYVDVDLLMLFC